jgi:hypothetical protein
MKNLLAACLLTVLFSVNASALPYSIYGVGAQSCETWVKDRNGKNHDYHRAWLLGYISGVGAVGSASVSFSLQETGIEAMVVFVDNHCQKNPVVKIEDAGYALAQAMR